MTLKVLDPADYTKDPSDTSYLIDQKSKVRFVSKTATAFIDRQVAEKLAQIWHPGLPRCLGTLTSQDGLAYVFEYLPGQSLDSIIEQETHAKEPGFWLPWMIQWASSLAFLHQQGERPLLHLDIKPANLLVASSGQASLIDFGAAVLLDENMTSAAIKDRLALTLNYAAPELIAGKPCPASDIFSLGLVMLALLTGQNPAGLRDQPLKELVQGQPAALQTILGKCLHSDLTLRYQQADELAADLSLLLKQMTQDEPPTVVKKPVLMDGPEETADVLEQGLAASLLCIWSGADFACELAVVLAQEQAKTVLVIDADLLNPRADLLLGQARQTKQEPEARGLGLALQAGQQGRLTPQNLASLCQQTAIKRVRLLGANDLLDEYEFYRLDSLQQVLRQASLLFDIVLVLCPRSIFDAFTCLCLVVADLVLVSLTGDLASFREANRMLEFMGRQHKMDFSRLAYVPFDYDKQNDLGPGTLGELCQGRLAGVISSQAQRRKALQTQPYAARLTDLNRSEYKQLIKRLNLGKSKGE